MDLALIVAFASIALMLLLILALGILSRMDRPRPPSDVAWVVGAVQRRQAARGEDCP